MRVRERDFERAFQGAGTAFEEFLNTLIRAAGRACGIGSSDIHWDHRTHVPDGGRDIVVRAGNSSGRVPFIPTRPSHWSLKSGADGVSSGALQREVLKQATGDHPKVRAALMKGEVFVWCAVHPIGHDKRDEMLVS
jgi:hypothetical protein